MSAHACGRGHALTADTIRVHRSAGRAVVTCGVCEDARNGLDRRPARPARPVLTVVPEPAATGKRTARVRRVAGRWHVHLLVDGEHVGPTCEHREWARAMVCATTWGEDVSRVRVREHPERAA